MFSLPQSVRTVKTPVFPQPLPGDDDEQMCAADAAVFASATDRRPVHPRTNLESFVCSPELARFIAAWRI